MEFKDLTPHKRSVFVQAIVATWNVIAEDVQACSLDEQIEVTLDADYLMMYGGLHKDDRAIFNSLSYEDQDKLAMMAFRPNRNR
jgi:hypothetical protein